MPSNTIILAMWSGPRNISTAMMRAWGSRADTFVHDEPFYAHYLTRTPYRDQHPGADEIIAAHDSDWRSVVRTLTGTIPDGKTIYYQKHMTHHLLDEMAIDWIAPLVNCFLIRDPAEMLVSLAKVLPNPQIDQTGLPQQLRLFEYVRQRSGRVPPVLDAADVLRDPRRMLTQLCDAVGVPFDAAMLSWSPGKRPTDGIWAKYWYAAVEQSTGFEPYVHREINVPPTLHGLLEECRAIYHTLYQHRLGKN